MSVFVNQNRSHIIKIRVNSLELSAIKLRAGSCATAVWLRDLAMDCQEGTSLRKIRHVARLENKNPQRTLLLCAVGRIGNNLNQITRAVNSAQYNAYPIELTDVAFQLNGIWEELRNVQQDF